MLKLDCGDAVTCHLSLVFDVPSPETGMVVTRVFIDDVMYRIFSMLKMSQDTTQKVTTKHGLKKSKMTMGIASVAADLGRLRLSRSHLPIALTVFLIIFSCITTVDATKHSFTASADARGKFPNCIE